LNERPFSAVPSAPYGTVRWILRLRLELVSVALRLPGALGQRSPGLLKRRSFNRISPFICETFRIIDKHLRVPLGGRHPVLGALELNMPTISAVHT